MDFRQLSNQAQRFLVENSPAILTGIGVAGTLTTAYLTGRATFKAAEIINQKNLEKDISDLYMPPKEKLKLVWRLYVPAAGTAALTIAAIIYANRISDKRAAALAAAYAFSQTTFEEYKDKVIEKMGPKKEELVRAEIDQERFNEVSADKNVVIIGKGDVLCFETFTGRIFMSDMETLRKAMNDINLEIINGVYASLTDFYHLVGLPSTGVSDDLGWNTDHPLKLNFTTILSDDNRPCLAFSYNIHPVKDYNQFN
jgi:hypothetical protein